MLNQELIFKMQAELDSFRDSGDFVLRPSKTLYVNIKDLPSGFHILDGESVEQALIRHLKETKSTRGPHDNQEKSEVNKF